MSKIVICTNCTEENNVKARYCSKCGYQLPEIEKKESIIKSPTKNTNGNNKFTKKKLVTVILFFVSFFSVFFLTKYAFKNDNIDSELTKTASEINKNCPIFVDQDTRLDNVSPLPDKTIQYNYTLMNYTKNEINSEEASKFIFQNSLDNIKNNPEMKYLREKNVNFIYSYKDKNKEYLFKVVVKPTDYN